MGILQKIYDTIVPVSWKNFNLFTEAISESLDGMTIAIEQQSEMIANLVNQVMELQKKKDNIQQEKEEETNDPSFQ